MRHPVILFAMLSWIGLTACASPPSPSPHTAINEAEAAIRSAELMGAQTVAPENIERARQLCRSAARQLDRKPRGRLYYYVQNSSEIKKKALRQAQLAKEQALIAIRKKTIQVNHQSRENARLQEQIARLKSAAHQTAGSSPASPTAEQIYQKAFYLFHNREYQAAAEVFDRFLQTGERPDLRDNAHYWTGECHWALQAYKVAIDQFEAALAGGPDPVKAADSLLKLGLCREKLGNTEGARKDLQELIRRYPQSQAAGRARRHLNH